MDDKESRKERIKYILDITEDIMTILVSLGAIGGTIIAYENGFWHKLKHIVDKYHEQLVEKDEIDAESKILKVWDSVDMKIEDKSKTKTPQKAALKSMQSEDSDAESLKEPLLKTRPQSPAQDGLSSQPQTHQPPQAAPKKHDLAPLKEPAKQLNTTNPDRRIVKQDTHK